MPSRFFSVQTFALKSLKIFSGKLITATGIFQTAKIPAEIQLLPPDIFSLHRSSVIFLKSTADPFAN
jgi:hypothetical protein